MRLSIMHILLLAVPAICSAQTTWFVPDDFSTIQGAISNVSVVNGDTVVVRQGIYVENIGFLGKAITLKSESGSEYTVIDGNEAGSVVTCTSGEGQDTMLDGFTITNGSAYGWGGGMYNGGSSPTVKNCIFSNNKAGGASGSPNGGAGMYNGGSSPTVTNCTFVGNIAFDPGSILGTCGGGMFNEGSSPTVTNCEFIANGATLGGGIGNGFPPYSGNNLTVINCTFYKNSASRGGGIGNSGGITTVTNCSFHDNGAHKGGGIYNHECDLTVTNCILWNNPGMDEIYNDSPSHPTVTCSCVQGGYTGVGNIDTDPLFVDAANGDFHLTFNSPCRGSGDNSNVTELYDFEGDPRIWQGTVDIGADEFHPHLYYTGEATPSGTIQAKFVGLPGAWIDGVILGVNIFDPPLPCDYGLWYMDDPMQIIMGLGTIPVSGVAVFSGTLPSTPPAPYTIYLQAAIDSWLTNLCTVHVQ